MNLSNVNIGTGPSAGDGDPLRTAFTTINNNFQIVTNNVNALTNSVTSVAGRTGNVILTVNDIVGLSSAYASQANITTANTGMRGYVDSKITANIALLVNAAPSTLDTIRELADAIGDDPDFAVNIALSVSSANTKMRGYVDGQITAANAGVTAANLGMKGYVDSVATLSIYSNVNAKAYTESMGFQNFGNVNVAAYVTTANSAIIGYVDLANTIQSQQIASANIGIIGYIDLANTIQSAQVGAANLAITAANLGMKGYVDSVASQSIYGNGNVKSYLTQFDGNIIPSANAVYSLGNSTTWWKDLWLSANTLYIGGVPIGTAGGELTFGGNAVGTSGLDTYTGNVSASNISVGSTTVGNTTTTPTFSVEGSTGNITAGNISAGNITSTGDFGAASVSTPTVSSNTVNCGAGGVNFIQGAVDSVTLTNAGTEKGYNRGFVIYPTGGTGTGFSFVIKETTNPESGSGNISVWEVYNPGEGYTAGDELTFDSGYGTPAEFIINAVNDVGTLTAGDSTWSFDPTGDTTIPGNISLPDNTAIYNEDANTAVFTSNVISDATSIYLTDTGNAAVYASDSVVLETNSDGNVSQQWIFNADGSITFPDGGGISPDGGQTTFFGSDGNNAAFGQYDQLNQVYTQPTDVSVQTSTDGNVYYTWSYDTEGNLALPAGEISTLANNDLYIGADSGQAVRIAANSGAKAWNFNSNGSVTFPDNTLQSTAGTNYSNVQLTSYLPTYSGNIANVRLDTSGVLTFADGTTQTTAAAGGGSSYGNANVASYLPTYSGNISAGNVSVLGNVTADYFIGPLGSITNLDSLNFSVENISARIAENGVNIGAGGYNNLVVLPTEVLIQNVPLTVAGNIVANQPNGLYITANTVANGTAQTWNFGTDGRLTFPGTPRIDTDSNNFEVQAAESINFEANAVVNIYTDSSGNAYQWQFGDDGRLAFPGTPVIDTDANNFDVIGAESVSLEANAAVNIYTDTGGSAYQWTFGTDGNLILPNVASVSINYANGVSILSGLGSSSYSNVQVATYLPTYTGNIANVRLDTSGVLTFADGTTQTTAAAGGGSSYGNANVTAYTVSMGFTNFSNVNVAALITTNGLTNYSNVNVKAYTESMGFQNFGNVNVAAYVTSANSAIIGYIDQANTIQSAQVGAANLAITAANLGMKGYVDSVASQSIYGNGNVKSYLTQFDGNIIPSANVTYSLGNVTNRWKDLYISGNTIFLGDSTISTEGGRLVTTGVAISPPTGAVGFANVQFEASTNFDQIRSYYVDNNFGYTANLKSWATAPIVWDELRSSKIKINSQIVTGYSADFASLDTSGGRFANAVATLDATGNIASLTITDGGVGYDAYYPYYATDPTGYDNNYIGQPFNSGSPTGKSFRRIGLIPTNANDVGNITSIGSFTRYSNLPTVGTNSYTWTGNTGTTISFTVNWASNTVTAYTYTPALPALTSAQDWQNWLLDYQSTNDYGWIVGSGSITGQGGSTIQAVYDYLNREALPNSLTYDQSNTTWYPGNLLVNNSATTATLSSSTFFITFNRTSINYATVENSYGNPVYWSRGLSADTGISSGGDMTVAGDLRVAGDLYVSPTSIYMGYLRISAADGNLKVNTAIKFSDDSVQSTAYSNVKVATYLPTYTGNIANVRLGTSGVLTFSDGTTQTTAASGGGSSYGNANVASYLPTYSGVVTASNVAVNGNVTAAVITAQYLFGNGSQLTGIVASGGTNYSNVNAKAYTESMGFSNFSNVNVAAYVTTANSAVIGYVDNAVSTANVGIIGYIDRGNTIVTAGITTANVGMKGYVDNRSLDNLSDVVISSPTVGDVLYYNGTNWEKQNGPTIRWSLSNSGTSDYVFTGPGFYESTNDPVLYLHRGTVYIFSNGVHGSHPLEIRVSNGGAAYANGVSGAGTATITFTVPMNAPSTLYYQCTAHSGMGNTINVVT